MSDKTKKVLKIAGSVSVVAGTACLVIVGTSAAEIASFIPLTAAVINAIGALILAIFGKK